MRFSGFALPVDYKRFWCVRVHAGSALGRAGPIGAVAGSETGPANLWSTARSDIIRRGSRRRATDGVGFRAKAALSRAIRIEEAPPAHQPSDLACQQRSLGEPRPITLLVERFPGHDQE